MQEKHIAPALIRLCRLLDDQSPLTRDFLRQWIDEYAETWRRIHVFFDAYGNAARTDPAVAATMLPNSYHVISNMTRLLGRVDGPARQILHDQLVNGHLF